MNILTDPVFGNDLGGVFTRSAPPGLALRDLPPIDLVLISHNHRDHLDEDSIRALGNAPTYVVPLGMKRWFQRRQLTKVIELDWWQEMEIAGRNAIAKITMVPAQHWSARLIHDRNLSLWGGYIIDSGSNASGDANPPAKKTRLYFAGDTGYPAAFGEIGRRFPDIDFAFLPIGAYAPRWYMHPMHMSPEEAAEAFRLVHAKTFIPMHWGTFRLADEPMDEPPRLLREALGPDRNRLILLPIGGSYFPH